VLFAVMLVLTGLTLRERRGGVAGLRFAGDSGEAG
jgi:hypothetical protein